MAAVEMATAYSFFPFFHFSLRVQNNGSVEDLLVARGSGMSRGANYPGVLSRTSVSHERVATQRDNARCVRLHPD